MMQKLLRRKSGFTLIELMIVVVIIGILAAIAIPAFIRFVKRSKTSEATSLAKSLYEGAKTYYDQELWGSGLTVIGNATAASTSCMVPSQTTNNVPTNAKFMLDMTLAAHTSFAALGFAATAPVYYQYQLVADSPACGNPPLDTSVYTFRAIGDLDGDSALSTFELAVGSDGENSLYHAPGFYILNELE